MNLSIFINFVLMGIGFGVIIWIILAGRKECKKMEKK